MLHPMVREDGGFRRASWDEALDQVAEALLPARDGSAASRSSRTATWARRA